MTNVRHIFFDLDHTIWDFEANSKAALSELFSLHENKVGDIAFEIFLPIYIDINEAYWEEYRLDKVDKETLRVGRFKDAFHYFGKDFDFEFLDQFAKDYLARSPYKTNLFPGAFETLNYLKGKYQLHIITNGFKEVQYIKLDSSNLASYFDIIICSDEVGFKKPNAKIFELALEAAQAKANESLMIGDSEETDVMGAIRVGMQAFWFNPLHAKNNNAFLSIHNLTDLIQLL